MKINIAPILCLIGAGIQIPGMLEGDPISATIFGVGIGAAIMMIAVDTIKG